MPVGDNPFTVIVLNYISQICVQDTIMDESSVEVVDMVCFHCGAEQLFQLPYLLGEISRLDINLLNWFIIQQNVWTSL